MPDFGVSTLVSPKSRRETLLIAFVGDDGVRVTLTPGDDDGSGMEFAEVSGLVVGGFT